jgi:hypothetical protein
MLSTKRDMDLFSEQSLGHYHSIALQNKLASILGPYGAGQRSPPSRSTQIE